MTKEALTLALECAERCEAIDGMYSWSATITAIKDALSSPNGEAQPEQRSVSEHLEPVAKNESGRITWLVDDWPQNCFLYSEPPSWTPVEIGVDVTPEGAHVVGMYVLPDAVRYVFYSKFHTTPPQRKPLTDEEIGAILEGVNAYGTRLYTFARAIEAAHGIKE